MIAVGGSPVTLANVLFYADNGGMPNNTPIPGGVYEDISAVDDGDGNLTIHLPTSYTLSEGTYWMVVQSANRFSTNGQWLWAETIGPHGNVAHLRNPGDGFGTGCTEWTDKTLCFMYGYIDTYDQSFALYGPETTCTWLTANPSSGETFPNSSSEVVVTADASAFGQGSYDCEIVVTAENGEIFTIPVTLTVELPTPPTINTNIIPDTLTFFVNAGGGPIETGYAESMTIRNLGDLDLEWSIFQSERETDAWGSSGSLREVATAGYDSKQLAAQSSTRRVPQSYTAQRSGNPTGEALNSVAEFCWGYAFTTVIDFNP